MNVLVVGATGSTGIHIVERALGAGHQVTAFVRAPDRLERRHERLRIVQGDILNAGAVRPAVDGQHAVLCALGAPASSREDVRTHGTVHLVQAMEDAQVRRLVCMTTLGIGDSAAILPAMMKFVIVPFVLRRAFADHLAQEERIRDSSLDWTLVRPGHLTNGPATGRYQHGFGPNAKIRLKISRADVAEFMVEQLRVDRYLRRVAGISY